MPLAISGHQLQFLNDTGTTGTLIKNYNWEATPLGHPSTWPECIRIALSMCLNASFPVSICWGADFNLLYNDAYIAIAGDKHPWILGKPRRMAWPENHELVIDQFNMVMEKGISIRRHDQFFPIQRFDFLEECYFDYTLSPILDADGSVCGVVNYVMETTYRVINERRHSLLQQLNLQSYLFKSGNAVFTEALTPLNHTIEEIAFAMLYQHHAGHRTSLTQAVGMKPEDAEQLEWPFSMVLETGMSQFVGIPESYQGTLFPQNWPVPCQQVRIIPLKQTEDHVVGFLVIGIHPGIKMDDSYPNFLDSVAIRLRSAIVNALSAEQELHVFTQIRERENQLQFAIDAAQLGTWDFDPESNKFTGNERLKSWFGLPPEAEIDLSSATDNIIEKDRIRVLEAIQDALNYRSGGDYDIEYTIVNPVTKVSRIVAAKGKALFDEDFKAVRFSGTLQDITEEQTIRLALERLYEQECLSREAAQLGTFDLDLIKGTMDWDDRCRLLFGISHHEPVRYEVDFVSGLHPDDRERIISIIDKAFIKSISNGNYDVEYRTVGAEDGKVRWIKAKGRVFFDETSRPIRFIGSVLEITEQKEEELRKNDFISMVSHELKTPLTSLKGYVQLLNMRSKKEDNEFAVSNLNKVELQIKKMTAMINSFLNVSRLESGKIHVNMEQFDIGQLISEVIENAYQIYSSHELNLIPAEPLTVFADREKIEQVLTNLLSNAVKYSPRGKTVTISYTLRDDQVEVCVSDEGMGIRPQDKDRLFDRFYRVDSTHTQNISGFGIGLYLCAELIRRHDGRIWVESQKGVGSQFYFSIPYLS